MSARDTLFFIICAGLFFALSVMLYRATPLATSCFDIDSTGYDTIALNFAKCGKLCDPAFPMTAPVQTIGYHFFVGLIYKLFGHAYFPIIVIQWLLMLVAGWLLFCITYHLFGSFAARIAAILFVVNVGFITYPQLLLAETLTLFLLMIFLERFMTFLQAPSYLVLFYAGVALGVSLLIKPAGLLFCLCAIGFVVYRMPTWKSKVRAVVLFVLCIGVPLTTYMARNKMIYGHFSLAPMVSLNMYYVFLSKVIAATENISVAQAEQRIPPFVGTNNFDESGWLGARELFYYYVTNHPFICMGVWAQNVAKTAFGLYATQLKLLLNPAMRGGDVSYFTATGSGLWRFYNYVVAGAPNNVIKVTALFEALWSIMRWFLIIIGFYLLWVQRQRAVALFCLLFIINGLIITGFDGCGRYRIIVEPLLIVVAVQALVWMLKRKHDEENNIINDTWMLYDPKQRA